MTSESSDFEVLHALRVGGLHATLPTDADALAERGLIFVLPTGAMLTDEGTKLHEQLLAEHRKEIDTDVVRSLYMRFLAVNQPTKSACSRWQQLGDDDEEDRFMIVSELQDTLERVSVTVLRTGAIVPRFGGYPPRMAEALDRVVSGENDYLTGVRVASFHNIWMECHEDYLLTLDISREEEGSF